MTTIVVKNPTFEGFKPISDCQNHFKKFQISNSASIDTAALLKLKNQLSLLYTYSTVQYKGEHKASTRIRPREF